MNRLLILFLQVLIAVAGLTIWHVMSTTHLFGDPKTLAFFFSTPGAVVVRIIALVAAPLPSRPSTSGRVSHRLDIARRWPKGSSGATAANISAAAP